MAAPFGVLPSELQVFSARVCAIVAPAFVRAKDGLVFGNGEPVAGAPGFTGFVKPARPCEVILPVVRQPLRLLGSPRLTCSPSRCRAPRAAASPPPHALPHNTSPAPLTR